MEEVELSGFKIKGRPIEHLVVPELSSEIRNRGGKIKSNALKEHIILQLKALLEAEQIHQPVTARKSALSRSSNTATQTPPPPPPQPIELPKPPKPQPLSTAGQGKKYKSREDFYNRFKTKPLLNDDSKNVTTTTTTTSTTTPIKTENSNNTKSNDNKRSFEDDKNNNTSDSSDTQVQKKLNTKSTTAPAQTSSTTTTTTATPSLASPLTTSNGVVNAIELERKILNHYNLYPILERMTNNELGYILGREYVRFIVLKVIERDGIPCKLSPSPLINELWKVHILSTTKYDEFIDLIQFKVHNDPDSFFDPKSAIRKRYEKTLQLYKQHFKINPDPNIWPIN